MYHHRLYHWLIDVISPLQVIYVMRNPKDVFTSLFHYSKAASYFVNSGPQREFLHKFLDGKGWAPSHNLSNTVFIHNTTDDGWL